MVPRNSSKSLGDIDSWHSGVIPKAPIHRDFKLLSFGDEAEEEEEEVSEINEKQFRGKSKSSHDLLTDDKTLSSAPAVGVESRSEREKSSKCKLELLPID